MPKTKTDPIKEFQKQAVEQKVCLFYVTNRIKGILEESKSVVEVRDRLVKFEEECVRNIGINALIERYEYNEDDHA